MVIGTLNPWMFLPTAIMFVIFYMLRMVYLRTSRDVKRLEATSKGTKKCVRPHLLTFRDFAARSPIYSHLNASLQGLTTIRAFGVQPAFQKQFDGFQDINVSAWFTFVGCARSFGLWLDLHCVVFVALVIISFLFLQTGTISTLFSILSRPISHNFKEEYFRYIIKTYVCVITFYNTI